MININGKQWNDVKEEDVVAFIEDSSNESFFFEYKNDEASTVDVIKEISALSNTYGGYIFIGVEDESRIITGCKKWNEETVQNTIHDSITPTPEFDVRSFDIDGLIVLIIKIEEGAFPPYITNRGLIYERVSSGSHKIKDSSKLALLFQKQEKHYKELAMKIESEDLPFSIINSVCNIGGYIDVGFSLTTSDRAALLTRTLNYDFSRISKIFESNKNAYSFSRVGDSFVFTLGDLTSENKSKLHPAGFHNYLEILPDGSAKYRVILCTIDKSDKVDASIVFKTIYHFIEIYKMIFGEEICNSFIYAHKYSKLKLFQQFKPVFIDDGVSYGSYYEGFRELQENHQEKYGSNRIPIGTRVPKYGYEIIDKRLMKDLYGEFNSKNLINELLLSPFTLLGYFGNVEEVTND